VNGFWLIGYRKKEGQITGSFIASSDNNHSLVRDEAVVLLLTYPTRSF
jgi:hypothetical protein